MAQILVPDVSRWQGTINFDQLKPAVSGIIIKATGADGGLYTDSMLARNRDEARRVDLPAAFYHYKGAGSAAEQAEYCFRAIGEIRQGEFIVIDDENGVKVEPNFDAEFATKLKQLTGLIVPVYSNLSRFQGVDLAPIKTLPAWVAKYGANTGDRADSGDAPQLSGINIVMWQYTSAARLPGITENSVDMNVFYGSVDDFKALGAKGTVPAVPGPAPAPVQTPVATGNGIYTVTSRDSDGIAAAMARIGITDWRTVAHNNGIVAPYTIYPGQKLKVYGGTASQQTPEGSYLVVSEDNLIGIGAKTGHDWKAIAGLNSIPGPQYTIYAGQTLRLPGGGPTSVASVQSTYTVTSRDYDGMAAALSRAGRTDWLAVAQLNGIDPPYTIYPNQVLRLP